MEYIIMRLHIGGAIKGCNAVVCLIANVDTISLDPEGGQLLHQ
jgi:hypothetical protein